MSLLDTLHLSVSPSLLGGEKECARSNSFNRGESSMDFGKGWKMSLWGSNMVPTKFRLHLTCSWAIQALPLSSMTRVLVHVTCLVTGRRLLVDLHRFHIPVGLRSGLLKMSSLELYTTGLPLADWDLNHPQASQFSEVKFCNYIDARSIPFRSDHHADKPWLLLLVHFTFAYFSILQFQSFKPKLAQASEAKLCAQ